MYTGRRCVMRKNRGLRGVVYIILFVLFGVMLALAFTSCQSCTRVSAAPVRVSDSVSPRIWDVTVWTIYWDEVDELVVSPDKKRASVIIGGDRFDEVEAHLHAEEYTAFLREMRGTPRDSACSWNLVHILVDTGDVYYMELPSKYWD